MPRAPTTLWSWSHKVVLEEPGIALPIFQRLALVCSGSTRKSLPLHSVHSGRQKTETLLSELYLPREGSFLGWFFFSFCNTRQFLYSAPLGKHRFLYVAAGNGAA